MSALSSTSAVFGKTLRTVGMPKRRHTSSRAVVPVCNKKDGGKTPNAISREGTETSLTFQSLIDSTTPVATDRQSSFSRTPHFTAECEAAINEQINIEYNVSYIYHAMYAYFSRDNVYLPGIAKHFQAESLEERGHAELLMDYQTMRGGRVELQAIIPPQADYDHPEKGDALYAFELSLSLEKLNNDKLVELHRVAEAADDSQMQDFIEGSLLAPQVASIQEVSEMVAQLVRMGGSGEAVWHFDQALQRNQA